MSLPLPLRVEGDGGLFWGGERAVVVVVLVLELVGGMSCEIGEEVAVAVAVDVDVDVDVGLGLEEASSRAAE